MAQAPTHAIKVESASAQSATLNSAWTPTTGNLLVAFIASGAGTNTSDVASGSVNGSYTAIGSVGNSGTVFPRIGQLYKANCTGGLENLTISVGGVPGGGFGGCTGIFHEISGSDTTAPFTSGEHNESTFTATSNPQTAQVTNSVANSIFFAGMCNEDGANPITDTINQTGTSPTGWATFDTTNSRELNGGSFWTISVVYLVVSSSAATRHGWGTTSQKGNTAISCFKAAAGGAATIPNRIYLVSQAGKRASSY